MSIFDQIKLQARLTDEVIVSYSGGKDSAVVLDLCHKYFKTVHIFFMYMVQGLSWDEAVLKWAEQRYGKTIYRVPHWELTHFWRSGSFTTFDATVPVLSIADVYAHVRATTGAHWIAAGERAADSVVRNAIIKKEGSINHTRGRFFPIAYWNKEQVTRYVEMNRLKTSPEKGVLDGKSLNGWKPETLKKIKEAYPDDWRKIEAALPLIGVLVAKYELHGNKA